LQRIGLLHRLTSPIPRRILFEFTRRARSLRPAPLLQAPIRAGADDRDLATTVWGLGRFAPRPPRGTLVKQLDLDGVRAVSIATRESRADRHILYLHGGGHVSGSPKLYRDFAWRIAAAARARALMTYHRLAPEHPYPAAIEDAANAYRALVAGGADPRVALMGESAGILLDGSVQIADRTNTIRYSKRLYRERNCIERVLGHLKINRAIATRYDQFAGSFLGMLYLATHVTGSNLSTWRKSPGFRAVQARQRS
jgi:alpha/beta hydrolase fold